MRYLITFAYDGSKYKGYQKQPRVKTIQGELERALKEINNDKQVDISASGRTDAKVHAYNQKAHFDLDIKITCDKLKQALNSLIPGDIYVKSVVEVKDDFHARFNVKAKEYIYKINMGEYNPLEKDYVYQYNKRLDLVEMERALKYLEGEHDFKSFSKTDDEKEDYVRTIIQTNIIREIKDVNHFTISFLGTGFLRYQVRNMVGLLIEIGEGKRKSEDILEILEAKDRRKAGITAPGEGLYLKDVFYY
ncbi:MAG: tRNA pseudouridine(38-40) synthase TruA [Candidatus Faecisoma sp.]|mgnify:FL=1|nr:tRNA pseudouridine(38-40) synthase TruA [Acholeplasma sp.]MDY2892578.1 tRNA pseudouridine(38-40) synthase TruA [Candidatus Faecisoma sp.]CCY28105.1 tRNA pseudouridine synthase A [Acholeplasma sp. CAG:878]